MKAVLGIDTSCYRTSLAIAGDGAVYADERRLLQVPAGHRGLRQSEALFQHVGHLGELSRRALEKAGTVDIGAVCVSSRPRPAEGSYMPVFMAGLMAAQCMASVLKVPLLETSHQQGHLRAALLGSGFAPVGEFMALHVSGGTTELLRCTHDLKEIRVIGGTLDLHAGQLVDRIGVMLGLEFPAGPMLEELAGPEPQRPSVPTAAKGADISLSGAENRIKGMIASGSAPSAVAAELYSFLERSLGKMIEAGCAGTGLGDILITGGVAASARLRRTLERRLKKRGALVNVYWGQPALSGDNAVGVALLGMDLLKEKEVWGT